MKTAHQNAPVPQSGPEVANKDFVDTSIAAIPAGGAALVFQPGGVAAGNVYTSFALLYADLITTKGQRVLEFDNTFAACVVPAGTYNMDDVEWVGKKPGFGAVTVTIANGVTITGLRKFRSLSVTTANGASSPFTDYTTAVQQRIQATQTAFAVGSGSSPLFVISGVGDVIFDLYESGFYDATIVDYPVQASGTASVQFFLNEQSQITPFVIISAIGTTVQVNVLSSSASYNANQPLNLSSGFYLINRSVDRHFPSQVYVVADSPFSPNIQELVQIDASGAGAIVVNLPSISGSGDIRGQEIVLKEVSGTLTASITLVPDGVETIDGAASFAFTAGGQAVTIVSDGGSNWNIVAGGASISGSVVSHPISGAGRSSYGSITPRVVGSFSFNPSDYTVNATLPTLAFRALAANGVAALTNSVQLYNLTDSAVVQTLSFTSTSTVKQSVALTIGGGAGQIPNSEKIYEVRIFLGADPAGDPAKTIELYSAHLVAISSL